MVLNGAGKFEDPSSLPSEAPTTEDADSVESVKGGVRKVGSNSRICLIAECFRLGRGNFPIAFSMSPQLPGQALPCC